MILKNLTRKNGTEQLVNYIFRDTKKGEKIKPLVIQNLKSRNAKGIATELDRNFDLRNIKRKDNIRLHHSILSFSRLDKEKINQAMLKDIANMFIKLRGNDSQYVASVHNDKDHIHIHFVSSAYRYMTGESNRLTKLEFLELKLKLQEYQRMKYPELVNSQPRHNSKSIIKPTLEVIKSDRQNQKESILQNLESIYAKSLSKDQFLTELRSLGYEPYYRGGSIYGIEDDGRKFRFNTLGYDKEMLDALDTKLEEKSEVRSEDEKELENLQDLRDSKSQEKEPETDHEEYDGRGL